MYFAGARLYEVFQLSVLQGNLGLGIGVLSYAGALYLDIAADVDVVPDVEVFTGGISDALGQLGNRQLCLPRRSRSLGRGTDR